MTYFICTKQDNLYKICENFLDLNSMNIFLTDYNIIEVSQDNYNAFKLGTKKISSIVNNTINFEDDIQSFQTKEQLQKYLKTLNDSLNNFLTEKNKNNSFYEKILNYRNLLQNTKIEDYPIPMSYSVEKFFYDLGKTSFSLIEIP
jgi:predicted ribosome quality control (RQC) complex YloA/Tae2 family protein